MRLRQRLPPPVLWPNPMETPNPNFGQIVSTYWGGDSHYHGLSAQVTKRMSRIPNQRFLHLFQEH